MTCSAGASVRLDPMVAATAGRTRVASLTAARDTNPTPPGNVSPFCLATSTASLVLPTPPGPVSVTARASGCLRRAPSSASWSARPTNVDRIDAGHDAPTLARADSRTRAIGCRIRCGSLRSATAPSLIANPLPGYGTLPGPCRQSRDRLTPASSLPEALAAVHRSVTPREEWHLGLIATRSTDRRIEDCPSFAAIVAPGATVHRFGCIAGFVRVVRGQQRCVAFRPFCRPAGWAPARFAVAALSVVDLFVTGQQKWCAAVEAREISVDNVGGSHSGVRSLDSADRQRFCHS